MEAKKIPFFAIATKAKIDFCRNYTEAKYICTIICYCIEVHICVFKEYVQRHDWGGDKKYELLPVPMQDTDLNYKTDVET